MSFFKTAKPQSAAPSKPAAPTAGADLRFDPLPLPEVVESDSDTSWALWQDSVNPQDPGVTDYKDTEPMGLMDNLPTEKPSR